MVSNACRELSLVIAWEVKLEERIAIMSRNRSIATSEVSKARNYSESDYSKGSVAELERVLSRHVHIGIFLFNDQEIRLLMHPSK